MGKGSGEKPSFLKGTIPRRTLCPHRLKFTTLVGRIKTNPTHMRLHMFGGQRSISGNILRNSFETGCVIGLELNKRARLSGQGVPGILLSAPPRAGIAHVFHASYHDFWGLNSGSYACKMLCRLRHVPSPQAGEMCFTCIKVHQGKVTPR